jgi:hypothetical protein
MMKHEDVFWMVVGAILDAIEEAGDDGAPEGILYAALMDKMSLDSFNGIVDVLVRTGKITKKGNLLWVVKS